MGMELEEWTYKSCTAQFGVGDTWATLYQIESKVKKKGHATTLLLEAKEYYKYKDFGGSVALSPEMGRLYKKLDIKEYKE